MTAAGGSIMVLPMDVSNEGSVDNGLATIRASMPPIAGVAFGPLVLQDVMFNNMDLSLMEMVLAPKVTGARLLNERLSDPSSPLDFFVMVSGNPGQAAYSAANAFTHALAQQRRPRGMAGSTIDIGAVYGVGFIARAGREEEYDVVRFMFDEVNEWELHALFAEAVVAGRAPGTDQVELVTGMPYIDPADRDQIPYFDDPRLAYYKLADGRNKATSLPVIRDPYKGASSKRRPWTSAVTIGTWFSKNLIVDVPLLKILGGASVSDLEEESISRILPAVIPLAYDGSANEILKDEAPVAVDVEAMGLASNSGSDHLSLQATI
ncbi:polyketide synthase [Penicillium longicatenatum]|nr:polyketide synthase [Penicillium longicatenatum]